MLILGWHGQPALKESDDFSGYAHHDAAAVLLKDGQIVAAVEEERLNRVKHSNVFPVRAIRFCLDEAGASLGDVDLIVTDTAEDFCDALSAREVLSDARRPLLGLRGCVAASFSEAFAVDVTDKLRFCRHHIAHLHAAWNPSGFPEALVLCIDGTGDGSSGIVAHCSERDIKILRYFEASQSLGDFYTSAIAYIGYGRFDEYKVMGLAPYGDPNPYAPLFRKLYKLLPAGRYALLPQAERAFAMADAGLARAARRKGEPFTQDHKNFAASLQVTLECVVDHLLDFHRADTRLPRLCLSGGVAHNCSMNGRILRSGRFTHLYVQPLAHDAGNALGAALWAFHESGRGSARAQLRHLNWGPDVGTDEAIGAQLRRWGGLLEAERVRDSAETGAELIAGGQVIGWVQGRSEFGPRALGNRSILADPRPAENRQIINQMIKKRESYRPFAPAVTEERLSDYFELAPGMERVPFMNVVLPVRAHARLLLGAVTHVDGTARVQSVSRSENPRFHALIEAFGRRTGVSVLLNTSFNNNAEPIVDSLNDAIGCLLTTDIHALIAGGWYVRKPPQIASRPAFLDLVPAVPAWQKLVRRIRAGSGPLFSLESTASHHFVEPAVAISETLFRILLDGGTGESMRVRLHRTGLSQDVEREITLELYSVWARRAVTLAPPEAGL
jgi:carbamoyltransferase